MDIGDFEILFHKGCTSNKQQFGHFAHCHLFEHPFDHLLATNCWFWVRATATLPKCHWMEYRSLGQPRTPRLSLKSVEVSPICVDVLYLRGFSHGMQFSRLSLAGFRLAPDLGRGLGRSQCRLLAGPGLGRCGQRQKASHLPRGPGPGPGMSDGALGCRLWWCTLFLMALSRILCDNM